MGNTPPYLFNSAGITHRGCVRDVNQDALLARPAIGLWLVADGVGGHEHGEKASRLLVDTVASLSPDTPEFPEAVRRAILRVNHELVDMAHRAGPDIIIGSTVAVLIAQNHECVCLWAGDSRIYGLRHAELARLTRDHSEVEEMVALGQLNPLDSLHHPDANILSRAVGQDETLELDACVYDLFAGDRFMLCTDGLTKEVDDAEIAAVLSRGDCQQSCNELIELAMQRGCHDNIAVIVVDTRHNPGSDTQAIPSIQQTRRRV